MRGGVGKQRLGAQRFQDLDRVLLPVGCDVQVAARRKALGECADERLLQKPPLVMPLFRPRIGKEYMRTRERSWRKHVRDHIDRVVLDDADVRKPLLLDQFEQAADAGTVNLDPEKIVGRAAPSRSQRSSRPCRSRFPGSSGAVRPKATARSSGASENAMPKRGSSDWYARCCAGEKRPWRSTKLRIDRWPGVVACVSIAINWARRASTPDRKARVRLRSPCQRRRRCIRSPACFHPSRSRQRPPTARPGVHANSLRSDSGATRHTAISLPH